MGRFLLKRTFKSKREGLNLLEVGDEKKIPYTLHQKLYLCFTRKETVRPLSQFLHSFICECFIYSQCSEHGRERMGSLDKPPASSASLLSRASTRSDPTLLVPQRRKQYECGHTQSLLCQQETSSQNLKG
jgi:hypothetical protein